MDDTQTATTPTPASPPPDYGNLAGIARKLDDTTRRRQATTAPIIQGMKDTQTKEKTLEAQEEARPDIKDTPPPEVPAPDPVRGFASAAGIFAMLASALTHTPMTAAMSSMASAINARNANDMTAYEKHYQQWKEQTDQALKIDAAHRAKVQEALTLMQTDMAGGEAMLHAADTEYQDEKGGTLAMAQLWTQRAQLDTARTAASMQMKRTQQEIDENAPLAFAGASLAAAMKSGDPQKIAEAQKLYANAKSPLTAYGSNTPQGIALRQYMAEYPNASAEDIQKFIAGFKPTTGGVSGQQLADMKADLAKSHPEWTPGQLDQAANQQLAMSKKVPGVSMTAFVARHLDDYSKDFTAKNGRPPTDAELGAEANMLQGKQVLNANQFNTLEDRAQQFSLALDNVQRIRELLPKAIGIATRLGQPLEKVEAIGNMLGTDSSTDRADFESALAFLKTNAPLLLKQANPTSRAIGGDQALVNRIIRGEQWGDSRMNVQASMENLNSIFQQDLSIMQGQAKRSGRSLNLPSLTPQPGAPTLAPAGGAAPWENDPVAR